MYFYSKFLQDLYDTSNDAPTRMNASSCLALIQVSAEFRPLLARYCPRCRGRGDECLVEKLHSLQEDEKQVFTPKGAWRH